ncbi:CapA family protein [Streptococcus pneumoniae]
MKKSAFLAGLLSAVGIAAISVLLVESLMESPKNEPEQKVVHTARVMAHGDLLYHDVVYMSALREDGKYDFSENFQYVKPWFEQADLMIGDFEGTIHPDYPLAGYPLFNAPKDVLTAIKDAGYDVLDLAHNHILDSGLEGVSTTVNAFDEVGIDTVGVYTKEHRDQAPLLIKEVNGIKIAILAYCYGFNGLEEGLSKKDYQNVLSNLDEERMKEELKRAEKEADVTVVMPQMGVEYQLEPTDEQVALYHKMIDWGADVIFGGHPHVVEPSEIVEKDGEKKLIIYSMGNFISNQRIETMDGVPTAEWTERGVLMDVTFEKVGQKTKIQTATAHPSWVSRIPTGRYSSEGYDLYQYQTYILEDLIEGGKYREQLDSETKERVDRAYQEMNEHVHLNWK